MRAFFWCLSSARCWVCTGRAKPIRQPQRLFHFPIPPMHCRELGSAPGCRACPELGFHALYWSWERLWELRAGKQHRPCPSAATLSISSGIMGKAGRGSGWCLGISTVCSVLHGVGDAQGDSMMWVMPVG